MISLNITCNTTSRLLSSLCAIFLICPLTIIITVVLHFNYGKLFSQTEYLIYSLFLLLCLFLYCFTVLLCNLAQEFPSGLIKFYLISYLIFFGNTIVLQANLFLSRLIGHWIDSDSDLIIYFSTILIPLCFLHQGLVHDPV